MELFFRILKAIIDLLSYSSLIFLIYIFIFVRNGGEINLRYESDDEDDGEDDNYNQEDYFEDEGDINY